MLMKLQQVDKPFGKIAENAAKADISSNPRRFKRPSASASISSGM
jgi:hypothetical protein